ncbi:MAG: TIGR03749 family integrating conjugative element protein [Geminicoccaceae bacterium]
MRWIAHGLIAMFFWSASPVIADEIEEILRWDRAPLSVSLPVGKERYIWFPGRVQPGIPPELTGKLRVQAVGDTIYLLAQEPFEVTRLPVRDLDDDSFYLFDLKTDEGAADSPLRVVKTTGRDEGALTKDADRAPTPDDDTTEFGYVALTRFAAKQVYAPERLAEQVQGISEAPIPASAATNSQLFRDGQIEASLITSWRGKSGLHVTAVKVANATSESIDLDPRLIRGKWLAATFHHEGLGPRGQPNGISTLYLISDRPFLEVEE